MSMLTAGSGVNAAEYKDGRALTKENDTDGKRRRKPKKRKRRRGLLALLEEYTGAPVRKAAKQPSLFEDEEHPRQPSGTPKGGQFKEKPPQKAASEIAVETVLPDADHRAMYQKYQALLRQFPRDAGRLMRAGRFTAEHETMRRDLLALEAQITEMTGRPLSEITNEIGRLMRADWDEAADLKREEALADLSRQDIRPGQRMRRHTGTLPGTAMVMEGKLKVGKHGDLYVSSGGKQYDPRGWHKVERSLKEGSHMGLVRLLEKSRANRTPRLGSGERFRELKGELEGREGVEDPSALAAWIGRKKHGAGKMAEMSGKGRKRRARPGKGLATLLR